LLEFYPTTTILSWAWATKYVCEEATCMESSPIVEIVTYEDPDFLGIEVFLVKSKNWVMKHQVLVILFTCTIVKELSLSQVRGKALFRCPKAFLHQSITASIMALAALAFHGVLSNSIRVFFLLALHVFIFHCFYIFLFISYLLFALRWQDPS